MAETTKPPVWFWVAGAFALIWNLMGVAAYLMQVMMTEEVLAALPEAERALFQDVPAWAVGAFATAVFAGALGSLLLLLRKRAAMAVFIVSLIGIVVQMVHSFVIADSIEVYGPSVLIMPIMVLVIGVVLVWHAKSSIAKCWLA